MLCVNSQVIEWAQQLSLDNIVIFYIRMQVNKENRASKVSLPEFQGGSFQEYMEVLYTHQKTCEKSGKYMEAELAKKRLTKMKGELEKERREEMQSKHDQERREVETAHIEEITEFNAYWDSKMLEYQTEAEKLENDAIDKHQAQLQQFEQEIERSLGYKQKESSEMINLRKIQENLARQQKYVEAHKVQKQLHQLERTEYEKWSIVRNSKVKNLLSQLRSKQENQLSALRQRIEQGFEEQKKIRTQQCDKLIQKYQNFMKQLQNHHHQQFLKFDKAAKLQSTMSFSRTSSMSRALQSRN